MLRYCPLFAILAFCLTMAALPVHGQGTAADYERSQKLPDLTRNKVFKDRVNPHWLSDKSRFWYRNDLPGEAREFIFVDAVKGERKPAFDHARLAAALTNATNKAHRGDRLAIDALDFSADGNLLRFESGEIHWKCDLRSYTLSKVDAPLTPPPAEKTEQNTPRRRRRGERLRAGSPDGKWTVFIKNHNLYLREKTTGKESALSQDGNSEDGYSERVFWSPDSKKLVALRTKKGQEHKVYLIESSPRDQLQPKLHTLNYLKPGDRIPIAKPHLFAVAAGKEIPVKDDLFSNPWTVDDTRWSDVRWSPDSRRFTFVYNQRGHQVLRVISVDAESGAARAVIDEQSKTFIDYNSKFFAHYLDSTNEIIWMSERDGWNHLYLYDAAMGQVKNQITKGQWVVRGVDRVDDDKRQIWFRAGGIHPGQDPYYLHYCRINFDGRSLVCLTDGDGTHNISYSPDRRFLIDTCSRGDMAPITELRNARDGKRICELERADMNALRETGWKAPERFVAKGRDGQTDIYGVIFRPTNMDANKKYPIIEQIYAGPHGAFVPKGFRPFFYPQQLAELGFIVVQIDGMGTNYRSKAFHDVCCKNLGDAGLPDRILWIKAAAAKYPYMDLQRVGIYGGSAGGQNALRAILAYPDFYKAASANCGCHDNRMDKIWWNELWMGWPIGPHYAEQSNVTNAYKLRGKLLLTVGELDRNVDPASTMQVVNALIKAGKDFELVVVPGAGHGTRTPNGYARRREQDFFVRHLLGVEPPNRNAADKETTPSAEAAIKRISFEQPAKSLQTLQTIAEKSDYKATSRHCDVVEFCERLTKLSPLVRLGELGKSGEGRKLPLLILADPPVSTPEEAAKSGKIVVLAMANIHAGEVDGKEAMLMLARDLATAKEKPLLKDLILVFAPIFNADGNERIAKEHRRSQNGPAEGVGIRENAAGLDLNRDYIKLDSPEVRALVRFFNKWDPAIFIDCHTTNGSHHRFTITYEGPVCPAGDSKLIALVRDELFPEVSRRLEKRSGYHSFFYGNFSRDRSRWETVPAVPRYGTHYYGLRNRISILSESYTYAPFRDRVLGTRDFVRTILEYAAENKDKIRTVLREARKEKEDIALRHRMKPLPRRAIILGFEEERKDGRTLAAKTPKDYTVEYLGVAEPTLSVRRPYAYLVPSSWTNIVENLQRHGIAVEELREDIELDLEIYRIDKVNKGAVYQKRLLIEVSASPRKESRRIAAGTIVVKTRQPLGTLAAYLLEAQAEDGLCVWSFFGEGVREGGDYPVLRLLNETPLLTTRVRPLAEDRSFHKRIDLDMLLGKKSMPNLSGSPIADVKWLDDGEHFLQRKDGRLWKVHAVSGRAQPQPGPDVKKIEAALAALPTIDRQTARRIAARAAGESAQRSLMRRFTVPNPEPMEGKKGRVFQHGDDLYYYFLDGSKAVRLTHSTGAKELISLSPDEKYVAFVRANNLCVVDIATQTEHALTTDGSALVFNGKMDWVYWEEIGNRQGKAYWWSPDSKHLAFVRYNDTPVHKFAVLDTLPRRQQVELTPYPKAGDPIPTVKLGIVPAAGGPVAFVDLSGYSDGAMILTRAGWLPDSDKVYFYIQDRAQTWLDFCTAPLMGGSPARLFRDKTQAWVDDPGPPHFLKDGSFLLASERSGWRHLYHFAADGKLKRAVTSGPWEVRNLPHVDEKAGWVYFSATRDNPIGLDLYRVKLDGGEPQRLTRGPGQHRVSISPKATFFVDYVSSYHSPTTARLYRTDGTPARTLDTNPVYALEEYDLGKQELLQIKTPDGFVLEAALLKPPDFDPSRRYPVWFTTYGGPHAPVVHDAWQGGRLRDQGLANLGFLVFQVDPRSASGKGICSTWTAYRQLGVQELADIETAIRWLTAHSFVDAGRIGMTGHSYGGFMTAYALTHSKLFAAGVAGAPVTDWHNYDAFYTERYMNTPQENPDGYKKTSVVEAAANLHGRLLLIHGMRDDNVHVQNTLQLANALQRADKDFELMIYPNDRHGIRGRHYQRLVLDFMRRTLKPTAAEAVGKPKLLLPSAASPTNAALPAGK
jgi:dipeptidyl-peptidase-4